MWFYNRVLYLKDAQIMTNSVDSDQTAPSLFAQTSVSLSLNMVSLPFGFRFFFAEQK